MADDQEQDHDHDLPRGATRPRDGGQSANRSTDARGRASPAQGTASGHTWTFLSNHAHVLLLIARDPEMRLRDIAGTVGITERAVQRIVSELEQDGYITRERAGRRNHYEVDRNRPLRHPIEAHRTIADLISLLEKS